MHKRNLIYTIIMILFVIIIFDLKHIGMINIENLQLLVKNSGVWAPVIFILLYIILILFGFSAGVMTVTAGIIFNPYLAFALVMVASLTGATIAFLIGKHFRNKLKNLEKSNHKKIKKILKKIEDNSKNHGFMTILTLRIAFVPFIWLSYLSGAVKEMKFKPFITATLLTNIFGAFVYIFLGFSITQNLPLLIGAIIVVIIFNIIFRLHHKKLHNIKSLIY